MGGQIMFICQLEVCGSQALVSPWAGAQYPNFVNEEIEAQRVKEICPQSHTN